MDTSKSFAGNREMSQDFRKAVFLNTFIKEANGKTAKLFYERLSNINVWLGGLQKDYKAYVQAKAELEKWSNLETRKPASADITSLGLDIRPEISEAKTGFVAAKRNLYSRIRTARAHSKLHSGAGIQMTLQERRKVVEQINEYCQGMFIAARPSLEMLLFPDETLTVTEADLLDAKKTIDYPFTDYLVFINNIKAAVGDALINEYGFSFLN